MTKSGYVAWVRHGSLGHFAEGSLHGDKAGALMAVQWGSAVHACMIAQGPANPLTTRFQMLLD